MTTSAALVVEGLLDFTRSRFLEQPADRQHKFAARLLRALYCDLLKGEEGCIFFDAYSTLSSWMGLAPLKQRERETVANRYHYHVENRMQGVREEGLLPQVRKGDRPSLEPFLPIAIYLDELRSAHNVGSIVRTVEAFRLGTLYLSDKTPDLSHPQVQKTSMGAARSVPWKKGHTLDRLPSPIIALETSPEALSLEKYCFPDTFTLVVGNEELGCSKRSLASADLLVEVPLLGEKNSLNVANALAIAAWEIRRQKRKKDL